MPFGFLQMREVMMLVLRMYVKEKMKLLRLKCSSTYHTSRFVVVQVHFLTQCASSFSGVDEFPCELIPENDIIGASTPFLFRAHIPKNAMKKTKRKEGTWNTRMIQVINSQFIPIVSHLKQIQTCSPAAVHFDGSNRKYMIQLTLRYMLGQPNVSLLHLWWHK